MWEKISFPESNPELPELPEYPEYPEYPELKFLVQPQAGFLLCFHGRQASLRRPVA